MRSDRPVVAGVPISNADRVIYPELGVTKLDVARYYDAIGDWMVKHVAGRPLTLVHCPKGMAGPCAFMRHTRVWGPDVLRRVRIQEKTKVGEYLVADRKPSLVGLAQMGVLEIHTWNSTIDDIERPDRIVIDLDPGKKVSWTTVVATARRVRQVLAAVGLACFPKTTGGRGIHVVVPLVPHADWSQCLEFSRGISEALVRADPDTLTTRFAKTGREGKILLDYLRNNRTNTSIAAFSTRARAGAPVSVPLGWSELKPSLDPAAFTIATVPRRFRRRADPWKAYWSCRQRLTSAMLEVVSGVL